jgi:protocatechuate 3,4-dioxygenase beta subunit
MTTPAPHAEVESFAVEIVAVATDQAATLDASVRRLHRHLVEHFPRSWRLTIADHASTDDTLAVAWQVASALARTPRVEGVRVVRLPERLDRKALRARWTTSPAEVAAFLTLTPDTDVDAVLAPLVRHLRARAVTPAAPSTDTTATNAPATDVPSTDMTEPTNGPADPTNVVPFTRRPLTRRTALFALGGLGVTAVLAACSNGSSSASSTTAGTTGSSTGSSGGTSPATTGSATTSASSTATTAVTATTAASVVLAPEMTEGPYYLDLDLVRSDITEDREGAAMAMSLVVIDVNSGAPVEGAAVDVWHCDANGLYSGFVDQSAGSNQGATDLSDSGTFLRGTQLTDASGTATFATIYPGWYQGRTVHIHIKVHVDGNEIHTGQLFFDDSFTDAVYAANEPYASRSERTTRNDDDNIYGGGGDLSTLTVQQTGTGYTGTLTMGVDG